MKNSGKALTIFLIVFVVILLCLTAISVFFFVKEVDMRKAAEYNVEQLKVVESKVQGDLKEAKKQIFVLEEKKKEAEDKIESLMRDVELEKGLREELKKENKDLTDAVEREKQAQEDLRAQLNDDLSASEEKISALQVQIDALKTENQKIEEQRQQWQTQYEDLQKQMEDMSQKGAAASTEAEAAQGQTEVSLDKIVVSPASGKEGQVISVDQETDFVIVSLGEKDGIQKGTVLSVYRGQEYLGDITVSRVLAEMSAADFVAPLSSQKVMKDDRVVIKQ